MKNPLSLHSARAPSPAQTTCEFAAWIREIRAASHRSALSFWHLEEARLRMSYPHYASIEAGKRLPDAGAMLRIARALEVDPHEAAVRWVRDLLPDEGSKDLFPLPLDGGRGLPEGFEDSTYVFQAHQADAFSRVPEAWAVVERLRGTDAPCTEAELAAALSLSRERVAAAVEWLRNEGVLIAEAGKLRLKKARVHWPSEGPFADALARALLQSLAAGGGKTVWRRQRLTEASFTRLLRATARFKQELEILDAATGPGERDAGRAVEVALLVRPGPSAPPRGRRKPPKVYTPPVSTLDTPGTPRNK